LRLKLKKEKLKLSKLQKQKLLPNKKPQLPKLLLLRSQFKLPQYQRKSSQLSTLKPLTRLLHWPPLLKSCIPMSTR
jgi:hypothetical protein